MDKIMSRATFIETLRRGRAEWDDALLGVPRELMEEHGGEGEWSIKDISAHITWYEREMLVLLRERAVAGSDLWELPIDSRNTAIFEEKREYTLDNVLAESGQTFRQLLREVEALSDEDLNNPARFKDMPPDWQPWKLIAENSYEHYPEHTKAVLTWLQQ